jgi:hypothetical protein
MFYQAADEKHEEQIDELMKSLGKFVVEFERVCATVRHLIIFTFQREGLKNQSLSQVVVGNKAAAELRFLFGALYSELRDQDDDDRKIVNSLLNRFDKLSTKRNILLHSEWFLGDEAGEDELAALIAKYKAKQKSGTEFKIEEMTPTIIDKYAYEARKQLVLFRRLTTSLLQSGYKPSEYLNYEDRDVEEGIWA